MPTSNVVFEAPQYSTAEVEPATEAEPEALEEREVTAEQEAPVAADVTEETAAPELTTEASIVADPEQLVADTDDVLQSPPAPIVPVESLEAVAETPAPFLSASEEEIPQLNDPDAVAAVAAVVEIDDVLKPPSPLVEPVESVEAVAEEAESQHRETVIVEVDDVMKPPAPQVAAVEIQETQPEVSAPVLSDTESADAPLNEAAEVVTNVEAEVVAETEVEVVAEIDDALQPPPPMAQPVVEATEIPDAPVAVVEAEVVEPEVVEAEEEPVAEETFVDIDAALQAQSIIPAADVMAVVSDSPVPVVPAYQPEQVAPPQKPQVTVPAVEQKPKVTKKPAPVAVAAAPAVTKKSPTEVQPTGDKGEVLFRDFPLIPEVQKAIERSGYTTPTEIQAQIIPYMLDGRDVLAQSQTGTGKTAAFALPILSRIDVNNRKPQVLVLAPTRELAMQVGKSFMTYGADMAGLTVATIYGGSDYEPQLRQLRRGAHVVVGTPGRTIDHINRGALKLDGITVLALDEADEMLNMGFLEDVQFVLERTPDDRQITLFSATMPPAIRDIAQRYLNNPARITVKTKTMTADSIRQRALFIPPRDKINVLTRFLEIEESDGVIVFTKTREATVTVAEALCEQGLSAVALNGDMPQKIRERTIVQLKSGKLDILVATDVAARGLDVQRISHVFNYDVPSDSESYVHRIGRTGRAGRKGEAIIFLSNSQRYKLKSIERVTRQPIEVVQPPTADDMNAMRILQFKKKISDVMENQDLTLFQKLITEHAEESGKPMADIAAALAHVAQGGRPFFVEDRPRRKTFEREDRNDRRPDRGGSDRGGSDRGGSDRYGDRGRQDGRRSDAPRQLSAPRPGTERFRIEVGSRDGVKPGNIVGAVANEGGIDGDQIGPISIHQTHSTVDLPAGMPNDILQTLQQTWCAGKQLQLSRDTGERGDSSEQRRGGNSGGNSSGGHKRSGSGYRPGGHGGSSGKPFQKRKPPAGGAKFKKRKPRSSDRD